MGPLIGHYILPWMYQNGLHRLTQLGPQAPGKPWSEFAFPFSLQEEGRALGL